MVASAHRRGRFRIIPSLLLALSLGAYGTTPSKRPTLTRISQVKLLSAEAARQRPEVRLRAVVTYHRPDRADNVFSIQDDSGAIFIEAPDHRLSGEPGD